MSRSRRFRRMWWLLALGAVVSVPARAEVGVVVAPAGDEVQVYVLAVVTDDSSPSMKSSPSSTTSTRRGRKLVDAAIADDSPLALVTDEGDPSVQLWVEYSGGTAVLGVTDEVDFGPHWSPSTQPPAGTRVLLNPGGAANQDGRPAVLRGASGVPIVAWARKTASGHDVVISTFANGAWTAPVPVAASPVAELDPQLAVDPRTGDVHLVYWIGGDRPAVLHTWAAQDLSSWSEPEVVSLPSEVALRPSAAFHDGALVVAYESHTMGLGTAPRQIVVATRTAAGFDARVLASTYHAGANRPGVHCDGVHLWVDWVDSAGAMGWVRLESAGAWGPLRFEPFSTAQDRDFFARGRVRQAASAE